MSDTWFDTLKILLQALRHFLIMPCLLSVSSWFRLDDQEMLADGNVVTMTLQWKEQTTRGLFTIWELHLILHAKQLVVRSESTSPILFRSESNRDELAIYLAFFF